MTKTYCFSINSYNQFQQLIHYNDNKKRVLIIYIKYYLIKGFGLNWLNILIKMIKENYSNYNIKFFIDSGNDHGLSVLVMKENIQYIKLRANSIILNKINQISKKNKVLLNPNFNVVDFSKFKKIRQKI